MFLHIREACISMMFVVFCATCFDIGFRLDWVSTLVHFCYPFGIVFLICFAYIINLFSVHLGKQNEPQIELLANVSH